MKSTRRALVSLVAVLAATLPLAGQARAALATDPVPPQPIDRQLFLRNDTQCDGRFISDADEADAGNGCGYAVGSLVGTPLGPPTESLTGDDPNETYASRADEVAFPITLDASRPLTGTIYILSFMPNDLQFDIVVKLGTTSLPPVSEDELYTGTFLNGPIAFPISIPIPASLDKTDVGSVSVVLVWKRQEGAGGAVWTELEDPPSSITVPAYDKSFSAA